ncbi:MAG TPA: galactose-1-phosphate uridylyltransferase [Streptosporangiaceae bacterium]|nr:galactose-1-phosphate uridylyltransferase [Streptosporangiaceae bacterium]
MNKTPIKLSDGRQLTYYDTAAGGRRELADGRTLSAVNSTSELRCDPFLGAWVIYATHRQDRSYLPAAAECPLCPSRDGHRTEIPAADYEVVVFENRFPALTASPAAELANQSGQRRGLFTARPSAGSCEVVCYTSDHRESFAQLSHDRVSLVLEALIDRTAELAARPGVEQVYCFENRGREIGVTQPHPHGQIYAYPFVTPRTERVLASVHSYFRRTRRNLFDDVLAAERADGSRLVLAAQHWTAFVPHAAHWPYEIHCYPNRRVRTWRA